MYSRVLQVAHMKDPDIAAEPYDHMRELYAISSMVACRDSGPRPKGP